MVHNSLKSAGNDSFKNAVEMLQPLLVAENHCPAGCPKVPAVRLAAMAPKMSKPAPPLPPQDAAAPAAKAMAKNAAVPRKAPPMMLLCAATLQATSTNASSDGSRARQDPYIGAIVPSGSSGR